jgi:major membrane immunogen (membrane-anchored lipoprotein)
MTANIENGGSNDSFSSTASNFAPKLIGLDAKSLSEMTSSSHDGVDFVAGATVSSKEILSAAIEACAQFANDKVVASLGYAATYEKATLSALPADTSIVNTYVGKVDDVAKVIGYEVNVIFSFDTGHGNANINGKLFITITLEDNLIVTSSLSNGGSAAAFSAKASEFAAKLVGLDSTVVATMTTSSHDGLDFVSGATVSSTEVLKLAISVANQYVNDKVVLNGGAA